MVSLFRRKTRSDDDLDEWERHHDDPRSARGHALVISAMGKDLSAKELHELWQQANRLVGHRAPADYGEFMAYCYFNGRRDALLFPPRPKDES